MSNEQERSKERPKIEKKTRRKASKSCGCGVNKSCDCGAKEADKVLVKADSKKAETDSLVGATISLNYGKRAFFGIGDFRLTPTEPTAVVPDGLPRAVEDVIRRAISNGDLVHGEPKAGIEKKVAVLQKYIDALKSARTVNRDLHPTINELARKREDGNYTVHEVIEAMLSYEVEHENRSAFVEYLNHAMSKIPGATKVTWTPPKENQSSRPAPAPSPGYQSEAKKLL